MGKRLSGGRDDSGSWLASLLILTIGLGCCVFLTLSLNPRAATIGCSVLAVIFGLFLLINRLSRIGNMKSFDLGFLGLLGRSRRDDGLKDYEPRRVSAPPPPSAAASNQPISAGEARELRLNSASTWVPARGRKKKSPEG